MVVSIYSRKLLTKAHQSTEFDIEREYVARIVGSGGAGVNRLRDQLGVKLDFNDDSDEKEAGKKKKAQKTHVKVRLITSSQFTFAHFL